MDRAYHRAAIVLASPSRDAGRKAAGFTSRNEEQDIIGGFNGMDSFLFVGGFQFFFQAASADKIRPGAEGVFLEKLLNAFFVPALFMTGAIMLRTEHDHHFTAAGHVERTQCRHPVGQCE